MNFIPEIQNGSIVVIGLFSPAQFTPDWLYSNNLIGEIDKKEMKDDSRTLVAQAVSQLECNSFSLQVTQQRIQVLSKDVLRPTINDLIKGIISLLGKVTIQSVGINFFAHYRMRDYDSYHKVGDVLAPKKIWLDLFPDPNWSAGLADLSVKISFEPRTMAKERDDGRGITVRIQPSAKIDDYGIMLSYNNHANFDKEKNPEEAAYDFLDKQWDESIGKSSDVFSKLLNATL